MIPGLNDVVVQRAHHFRDYFAGFCSF